MISENIEHIIWDWNGTLFNDVELCRSVINNILVRQNLPELTLDRYRDVFTFPVRDYYERAGIDFNVASFEELGKNFMDEYEQRKYESDLFPGTKDVLEKLKRSGINQSILSAYQQKTLDGIIKHYNIDSYFENVKGLDNIYAGGKVDLGMELIAQLKSDKDKIVLIGDTVHDKEVADAMGINSIIISAGHQAKDKLVNLGVPVLSDISELLHIPID